MDKSGFVLCCLIFAGVCKVCLSDLADGKLRYYETLKLSDITSRTRRGANPDPKSHVKEVRFSTLGRHFHVLLKPDPNIFPRDFKATVVRGNGAASNLYIDQNEFYSGKLKGEDNSRVTAHWEGDALMADISTHDELYIIEPVWRVLGPSSNHSMITYRRSDIDFNPDSKRQRTCGIKEDIEVDKDLETAELHGRVIVGNSSDFPETKRVKRQQSPYLQSRTTCRLMVVADFRFYENMGGSSASITAFYLIHAIQFVNEIYRNTEFDASSNTMKGIGFEIGELRIHNESTTITLQGDRHYNSLYYGWDTRGLLEAFSKDLYFHKRFCLAHLFTYQSFSSGVLGLAYIASERSGAVGGLCSPIYPKGGKTLTLNTGWSTLLNAGNSRILTLQAQLVTTHELGHNLGSEHDPETDSCAPSERHGGRYVMYPWAVHGYDDNNQFFSPCSREYIFKVAKAKGYDCFTERKDDGVFCGNGRLDEGETCDGGWETQNDKDPCCNSTCHLRDGMECSPMNYACCEKCHVASSRKKCQEEALNSCEPEVLCDGVSLTCPKTGDKSSTDNRSCIDEGICKNGNCLNYCQRINITLTPCICPQASGQACYRCCKPSGGACESYRNTLLPDGRPCFQGICKKGVCAKQRVDMVERLFSLIDDITVDKLVEFMRSNIVGTVIVLSLIIWIPASCTFSYIDKRNEREEKASRNWMSRSNHTLLMDEDKPRIRHITNPRILRHQASVIRAQMAGEEGHHLDESVV